MKEAKISKARACRGVDPEVQASSQSKNVDSEEFDSSGLEYIVS